MMCTGWCTTAASNNAGACHDQSAAACRLQATAGRVSARTVACKPLPLHARQAGSRQATGNAQTKAARGRPSTSNGAATSMSSSCCTMCAQNRTPPRGSSGDSSASASASQPAAYAAARAAPMPAQVPALRQSRRTPRA